MVHKYQHQEVQHAATNDNKQHVYKTKLFQIKECKEILSREFKKPGCDPEDKVD